MTVENGSEGTVSDAPRGNWVDRLLPGRARPYARLARLDRPIGCGLLLLPCWWSAALAANWVQTPFPHPAHLILFFIGAIVMRGAGCTYNDIVDRKIDAEVARTRSRPIPSGQVGVPAAILFLVVLALFGLAVLIQFDPFTILLWRRFAGHDRDLSIFEALHQLAANRPRDCVFLGGVDGLVGASRDLAWPPFILYLGCIFWVIGYDTIYALQDKRG